MLWDSLAGDALKPNTSWRDLVSNSVSPTTNSVSSTRGRKPIGERAMTSTERVQLHRERKAKTS